MSLNTTIVAVAPAGYAHAGALAELTETVVHGLQGLGYETHITSNLATVNGDSRAIIVGAHLLTSDEHVPPDAIIYNSEHVIWIKNAGDTYRNLLSQHEVWDASASNAELLGILLGKAVQHVPLGYVPELTRITPATEQDIDVLFYGSMNPRREKILTELREAGMKVAHAFGEYGEARDKLIARAKVVLNMHYYIPGAFEIVRVSYLLANRKAVVAEVNAGEVVDADITGGIIAAPYEHLVDACRVLVNNQDSRHQLEDRAFEAFSARKMVDILAQKFSPIAKPQVDIRKEKTVGLVMIVKNEAQVIVRALDSMLPLIDYVFIEDTGSTDGTQDIIKGWLSAHEMPGQVIEEPWRNFAYNRSHLLKAAREVDVDYAFMLDADEIIKIVGDPQAIKRRLMNDCYHIDMLLGSTAYALPRLTNNKMPFFYRGPVHEWPDCETNFNIDHMPNITIVEMPGGAREHDPDTYRKDAQLLEDELKRDDLSPLEVTRYHFYMAQSLRDSNQPERALEAFNKRIELGGWHEEIYISLLNVARLKERLNHPLQEIIKTYKRAMALNPKRLEAIHGAVRTLRLAEMYNEAYSLGEPHITLPLYVGLFVETWIYDHGLLDEFAICAYYANDRRTSWLASRLILCSATLDEANRKRIALNAEFARR